MSVLPLYHRIFLSLRDQIVNGELDWREPMPGEQKLSAGFKVSRATIRRALDLLEEEGLIVRRQGARTYPKAFGYAAKQQRRNIEQLGSGKHHIAMLAGDIQQDCDVISCDKTLKRQFGNRKQLGRVVRVRKANGKPYCFVVTYLPVDIADRIDWPGLGRKPVITAVIEAGHEHAKVEQVISATVADAESAVALDTPIGSPLLCVSGLFIGVDGSAFMRKDGYFRPESFEYRMTLYNKSLKTKK